MKQDLVLMNEENKTDYLRLLKPALTLVITLFLIMSFVVSAYRIPTGSMEKTLMVGDMLLVNKFVYGFRTPDRIGIPFTQIGFGVPWFKTPLFKSIKSGDVVVFRHYDENLKQWLYYVKRCVGLPGQTVEIINKELYVDGKPFGYFFDTLENDPGYKEGWPRARFADRNTYPPGAIQRGIYKGLGNRDNFGPLTVPDGNYFMIGDNRDNSYDSRFWGFVQEDLIIGKPVMVYFSFDSDYPLYRFLKSVRWERIGYFIQ